MPSALVRPRSGKWIAGVCAALAERFGVSPGLVRIGFVIFGIVAISLVILTGWGGQISLGQFAFVAVGGVVGASITSRLEWPFLLAVPIACLVGAAVAVVLGLPARTAARAASPAARRAARPASGQAQVT
ncbi:MAG: PspC domain-containing protein [Gemmatimonadetes bacterium]|nr:PspC domain-containing protein [Gemmatimonadota bacterium]